MKLTTQLALITLAASGLLAFPGCEKSRDEMRPDMDKIVEESGLQSRDLREMTDRMAPKLLAIKEIAGSPYKVIVVCEGVTNKMEGEETRDIDIYIARLAGLLNSSAARDRMTFVEKRPVVDKMAAEELGNRDPMEQGSRYPSQAPNPQLTAQYALYGEFRSMRNSKTTYYLCTFKFTNLNTRAIVWQDMYDTRTLNVH
jgi:hypothetical protein